MYYPIFLDLKGSQVLIAGAGRVALRKVRGLLEAGAVVRVVAPEALPEFSQLNVTLIPRPYQTSDLTDVALVFAATDNREVNARIAAEARERRLLVNVADSAEACDFHVPARASRANIQVAVSTGGQDPKLAVAIRDRIQNLLQDFDSSTPAVRP